jgi:hypothetical protein
LDVYTNRLITYIDYTIWIDRQEGIVDDNQRQVEFENIQWPLKKILWNSDSCLSSDLFTDYERKIILAGLAIWDPRRIKALN